MIRPRRFIVHQLGEAYFVLFEEPVVLGRMPLGVGEAPVGFRLRVAYDRAKQMERLGNRVDPFVNGDGASLL